VIDGRKAEELIDIANSEEELLVVRIDAAQTLLVEAENKLRDVNHQVDIWRNKWLNLTAQKVQERSTKAMQDTVTQVLESGSMSESQLLAQLQMMIDKRKEER